jgi:eukaryotic-like serine/threonine-protein kinase
MEQVLAGPGTVLAGRYAIERELGRGGSATVYLALDQKHGRPVAIKLLRPQVAELLGARRFLREIRIAARLTHPSILPVHDSGTADGQLFYVMPYAAGETLRDLIRREGQLPLDEALRITREVAEGLAYAHREGVVHRDIKPENILLEAGHPVIADFGIARALQADTPEDISSARMMLGTPAYMSPEQMTGGRELDGRSDLYSLGCVLYEMLAGEPPFTGPSAQAIAAKHLQSPVPSLRPLRPNLPLNVTSAVTRALAKTPADRFQTVEEFARALSLPDRSGTRWPRARLVWGALLLGSLALAGLLLVGRRYGSGGPPPSGLDPTHIAVLYFDTGAPDSALKWVADGLTEDLIDQLGQVEALSVISANGVRPYRDTPVPPDSIARALSVGTLVSGTVAGSLDRPRVTVRLIEPDGRQVDSRTIEAEGGDILTLRGELAQQVAAFLRQQLGKEITLRELRSGSDARAWVQVQRAEDLRHDAQALYRAGDTVAAGRTFAAADSLLQLAQRLDADWVQPTVLRGWIATDRIRLADARTDLAIAKWAPVGLALADQALNRRPGYLPALELRGTLRLERWLYSDQARRGDLEAAERDLRVAAAPENPNHARARSTLAMLLWWQGSFAEAHLVAQRAYQEDAFLTDAAGVLYQLYVTSVVLHRWDSASEWCGQGYRRFPDQWVFSLCRLTLLSLPTGKPPDVNRAWELVAEMKRVTAPSEWETLAPRWSMVVAGVLARAGLRDSARQVLTAARKAAAGDPELDIYEADVRVVLGEHDSALRLLERYVAYSPSLKALIRGFPSFDPLHRYPRFQALVADRQRSQ